MVWEPNVDSMGSGRYFSSPTSSSENVTHIARERIHQCRGKPDVNLSLCRQTRVPLDFILEKHGEPESLDLSYNYIRCLPSQFALKLEGLTRLDLSKNKLKKLPDNFGALKQLVYLDIHQNQLQTLPLSMGNMERLQYLNLTSNPFRPPLCLFLDTENLRANRELTGVDSAPAVIKFLARLCSETYAAGDLDRPYSNRGVTFDMEDRINESDNTSDEVMKTPLTNEVSQISKRWTGLVLFVFAVFLIPLFTAFLFPSAYYDNLPKNPTMFHYWTKYGPIHKMGEAVLQFFHVPQLCSACRTIDPAEQCSGLCKFKEIIFGFFRFIYNYRSHHEQHGQRY